MTLEEHARAIEAAIQAAADDGYELDNGSGSPIYRMDLNEVCDGDTTESYVELSLPVTTAF
ncbi:hypothetical protein [Streptomyces sp. NRRL S-378]|uniref:hypothetical protein n=1 Tax=Streptomyces sp. NRRL S-378 TaxID=1463904 RepID=UPI00068EF089|nr:hypothetical protein [Streptomyces sp. NRRL S-378]